MPTAPLTPRQQDDPRKKQPASIESEKEPRDEDRRPRDGEKRPLGQRP